MIVPVGGAGLEYHLIVFSNHLTTGVVTAKQGGFSRANRPAARGRISAPFE